MANLQKEVDFITLSCYTTPLRINTQAELIAYKQNEPDMPDEHEQDRTSRRDRTDRNN